MPLLILLGFGAFPIWLVILVVVYSYLTKSSEVAGMSLWYFIFAIPATGITLPVTMLAMFVWKRCEERRKRKQQETLGQHGRK